MSLSYYNSWAMRREQREARERFEREQREQRDIERQGMSALVDGAVKLANDTPEWSEMWNFVGRAVRRIAAKRDLPM